MRDDSVQPPMSATSRLRPLLAEFVVVFVSIFLALLADDWRENRKLLRREQEVLHLLHRDLRDDQASQEKYREELEGGADDVRRLLDALAQPGAEPDATLALLIDAVDYWNYRPTYPTYRGLVQGGRLGLVQDPALRNALVRYHDDLVDYLEDRRAGTKAVVQRAREAVGEHLSASPDAEGRWSQVWLTSPAALAADRRAMSALAEAGRSQAYLAARIEGLFLPESRAMSAALLPFLEEAPELFSVDWGERTEAASRQRAEEEQP